MKLNFYTLVIAICCFVSMQGVAQSCINDFEGNLPVSYPVTGFVNTIDPHFYSSCGDPQTPMQSFPGFTIGRDNLTAPATIVSTGNETHLANAGVNIPRVYEGGNALKLNPTNFNGSDKTSIRTMSFDKTTDILSFKFLHLGHVDFAVPEHPDAYFRYRLLNANTLAEVDTGCFSIDDQFDQCLYTKTEDPHTGNALVYTPNWVNREINLSQVLDGTPLILEFIVTDCGFRGTDGRNHFSTVYIDNICQISESENNAEILMDEFETIDCPTAPFEVSGSYTTPNCSDDQVTVAVNISPLGSTDPNDVIVVAQNTFTGFNFNFSIDPNNIQFDQSTSYDLFVTLTHNGMTTTKNFRGEEITFNGCSTPTQRPFITTWKAQTITIPTFGGGYDYEVDWTYDGVNFNAESTNVTGNITHTYPSSGTYTVAIRGNFPRIYFNNGEERDKIIAVNQWGDIEWKSMGRAFYGCSNLEGLPEDTFENAPDLSKVDDISYIFRLCRNLNSPVNSWDVSNIETMEAAFYGATVFNQPLNNWNVSRVKNMRGMFLEAINFDQNINSWNVGNVSDMMAMFFRARSFNQPLNEWSVSSVMSMRSMFLGAEEFNQNINSWDVSNVMDMSAMFYRALNFNQPLNEWKVNNVKNMEVMFLEAISFNQNINSWNVSKVTNMFAMFDRARSFNQPLNNWNVSSVVNMSGMFSYAYSFNQPLNNWRTENVTNMLSMFNQARRFDQNLGSWVIRKVAKMDYMLSGSNLSTENYEATLIGWTNQIPEIEGAIELGAHGLSYCSSEAIEARNRLLSRDWTISGDINLFCRSAKTESLTVFPNPGKNIVTVSLGTVDLKGYTIQLKDLSGRVLINQVGNATLNVSNLKKGVYIIQISNKIQNEAIQFMKE